MKNKNKDKENTFSEFDSISIEGSESPFNGKDIEDLNVSTLNYGGKNNFSNVLKKIQDTDDFKSTSSSDSFVVGKTDTKKRIKKESKNIEITEASDDYKEKKIRFIGHFSVRKQYQITTIASVICLIGLSIGLLRYSTTSESQSNDSITLSNISNNIQRLDTQFSSAVLGKKDSYLKAKGLWSLVEADHKLIQDIPSKYSSILEENSVKNINEINQNIEKINANMLKLNQNAVFVQNTKETVTMINGEIKEMNELLDNLNKIYVQLGANQAEISDILMLKNNLETINSSVTTILLSENISVDVIQNLNNSMNNFKSILSEIYSGNPTKGINPVPNAGAANIGYKKISNTWLNFADKLKDINNNGNELIQFRKISSYNTDLINNVSKSLDNLSYIVKDNSYNSVVYGKIIALVFILLLIACIFVIFYIYNVEKDNRSAIENKNNQKNSFAIFQLVREMTSLQEGDLTKQTTVNDSIVGGLADAINSTIRSLSSIVKNIKDTSFIMRQKANEVNVISVEMLRANEEQTKAIEETGHTVLSITESILQISEKTNQGAEVAENSVKVSSQGAEQVLASINSMQIINKNMSETTILMKKLSDSSKQISEIVEVLADISENTSILALNATVQASRTGEAGKSFKIVADSIQELADKAGDATRRVGALISTVQTDIQAAEEAVLKTTLEVNSGAELSEKASESLNKMTDVSNQLAVIVRTISEDAKKNAQASSEIASKMNVILQKTEENKYSTQKTVNSISEIAQISNELGESVQSFKVN